MRRPLIAGNWKMNGTLPEARILAEKIARAFPDPAGVEIVLCPPFTALAAVGEILRNSPIALGGQSIHWEPQGAFTGEISAGMLKDTGCRFVILGHSERRSLFAESDDAVCRKLAAALKEGLQPILCVGETLAQRQAGKTWEVVEAQLEAALGAADPAATARSVTIAYEPVWAIGTGQNAAPAQAQEVHAAIRSWLAARIGQPGAQQVRIQYGGSVKPDNAAQLLAQPDVDGALVGGASLDADAFITIVKSALGRVKCSTGSF